MITQARLKATVHYDPVTGIFTNVKSRGAAKGGTRAGTVHTKAKYRYITIDGYKDAEHRFAFLYMLGRLPPDEVDHKNGIVDDNRWCNLREANRFQNLANSRVKRDGLKGVSKSSPYRWAARILHNGKLHRLGYFDTEAEAHAAYAAKALELNGEFARTA